MSDELIIIKEKDRIFIKSLDEEIFRSRISRFLKSGYSLVGKIEILNHGLCKAQLKKNNPDLYK